MPRHVDPARVGPAMGIPVGTGMEVSASSMLGVGGDSAATVGPGAVAGVAVGRGGVATSAWWVVFGDCTPSARSACGAVVGPATVDGSCPAVHAAKINAVSTAVAISLDILWALSFLMVSSPAFHTTLASLLRRGILNLQSFRTLIPIVWGVHSLVGMGRPASS